MTKITEAMSAEEAELRVEIVQAMQAAGARPEWIYAFQKTGLMPPTKSTAKLWPKERLAEWKSACAEYHKAQS